MTSLMTRRQILAAAPLALVGSRGLQAQGARFDFDCVIIGAGAAGIAAAHELKKRGKKYIVLEARDRVGGRIITDTSLGVPYDAGAFYIHWAEKNPWLDIAREAGVKPAYYETFETGDRKSYDRGTPPAPDGAGAAWERAQEKYEGKNVPDSSFIDFATYLEPLSRDRALVSARLGLGEEGERISARDYARLWSGYDYLVPGGFGTAVAWYARGLNIRLSSPVSQIDWSGAGVRVTAAGGTISAGKVIITASVGVLKAGAIRFVPELPQINRDGLAGLGMGASTRAALRFNGERFGLKANSSLRLRLSERASLSFGCFAFDRDIVTCYFGGDHARGIIALGETAALQHIVSQFASLVGSKARKAYAGGRLNAWWSDPWSRGGYSHAKTKNADARFKLATPVGERIVFAGEAVGCSHKGGDAGCAITAGGAFKSGVTAAQMVAA
jgi:monoamine oxidase